MCKFCQWVYQWHFRNQYWLEDAVWFPMTGGTGSCELSFGCWESKVRPCGWTASVLSSEPSIQPHEHVINLSKVWLADLSSYLPRQWTPLNSYFFDNFHFGKRLTADETICTEETFSPLVSLEERQELRLGEGFRDWKTLIIGLSYITLLCIYLAFYLNLLGSQGWINCLISSSLFLISHNTKR